MQTLINLYFFLLFVLLFFLLPRWWSAESVGTQRAHAPSRTLCLICHQTYLKKRIDVHRVCAQRGEFEKGTKKKKYGLNASVSRAIIEIFPGSECHEEVYSVRNILSAR